MCTLADTGAALTHWNAAQRVGDGLGATGLHADPAVDGIAARIRRELRAGARPSVALARSCALALRVLPDERCTTEARVLPASVAMRGGGHEFGCALVAQEAARRAAIEVRLALLPDVAMLAVRDDARHWSVVLPEHDGIAWVPMPATLFAGADAALCCPHDAARTVLRLLAPMLPADRLPAAMELANELTA